MIYISRRRRQGAVEKDLGYNCPGVIEPMICLKVERKEPGEEYRIENEREESHEDSMEMLQSESQETEKKTSQLKTGLEGVVEGWQRSKSGEFCCCLLVRKLGGRETDKRRWLKSRKYLKLQKRLPWSKTGESYHNSNYDLGSVSCR